MTETEARSGQREEMGCVLGIIIGMEGATLILALATGGLTTARLDSKFCSEKTPVDGVDLFAEYGEKIKLASAEVIFSKDGKVTVFPSKEDKAEVEASQSSASADKVIADASRPFTIKNKQSEIKFDSKPEQKDGKDGVRVEMQVKCLGK